MRNSTPRQSHCHGELETRYKPFPSIIIIILTFTFFSHPTADRPTEAQAYLPEKTPSLSGTCMAE